VLVLPADVQDRDAAKPLLMKARLVLPRLRVIWADGAYTALAAWAAKLYRWTLTTVLKPLHVRGFAVLPKRWIVERTFAWLGRYRRLSKDYEENPRNSETWIYVAMIHRMIRLKLQC
jgi:putative transposase